MWALPVLYGDLGRPSIGIKDSEKITTVPRVISASKGLRFAKLL